MSVCIYVSNSINILGLTLLLLSDISIIYLCSVFLSVCLYVSNPINISGMTLLVPSGIWFFTLSVCLSVRLSGCLSVSLYASNCINISGLTLLSLSGICVLLLEDKTDLYSDLDNNQTVSWKQVNKIVISLKTVIGPLLTQATPLFKIYTILRGI